MICEQFIVHNADKCRAKGCAQLSVRRRAQIAPVVDASSAQSRADVIVIFMSAVLLLTGLQWAALTPREAVPVEPDGPEVAFYDDALPELAIAELKWCAATARTNFLMRCPGFLHFVCKHRRRRRLSAALDPKQGMGRHAGSDEVPRFGGVPRQTMHCARRSGATWACSGIANPGSVRHSQAGVPQHSQHG